MKRINYIYFKKKIYFVSILIFFHISISFLSAADVYINDNKIFLDNTIFNIAGISIENFFQVDKKYIDKISRYGCNTIKISLYSFDSFAFESTLDKYNSLYVSKLDKIFKLAEKNNLYIILNIFSHNSYNKYIKNKKEFYYNNKILGYQKKRLKFIISRYKNRKSLLMWSIINDLSKNEEALKWFNKITEYARTLDKSHPLTASLLPDTNWEEFYKSKNLNIIQYPTFRNTEDYNNIADITFNIVSEINKYNKPVLVEFGTINSDKKNKFKFIKNSFLGIISAGGYGSILDTHKFPYTGIDDKSIKYLKTIKKIYNSYTENFNYFINTTDLLIYNYDSFKCYSTYNGKENLILVINTTKKKRELRLQIFNLNPELKRVRCKFIDTDDGKILSKKKIKIEGKKTIRINYKVKDSIFIFFKSTKNIFVRRIPIEAASKKEIYNTGFQLSKNSILNIIFPPSRGHRFGIFYSSDEEIHNKGEKGNSSILTGAKFEIEKEADASKIEPIDNKRYKLYFNLKRGDWPHAAYNILYTDTRNFSKFDSIIIKVKIPDEVKSIDTSIVLNNENWEAFQAKWRRLNSGINEIVFNLHNGNWSPDWGKNFTKIPEEFLSKIKRVVIDFHNNKPLNSHIELINIYLK